MRSLREMDEITTCPKPEPRITNIISQSLDSLLVFKTNYIVRPALPRLTIYIKMLNTFASSHSLFIILGPITPSLINSKLALVISRSVK